MQVFVSGICELRARAMQVQILRIRAETEDIPVDEAAFVRLGEIGNESTLRYDKPCLVKCIEGAGAQRHPSTRRYACQLLTPSNVLRRTNGKAAVTRAEVDDIHALFYHAKSSARKLADNDIKYMH